MFFVQYGPPCVAQTIFSHRLAEDSMVRHPPPPPPPRRRRRRRLHSHIFSSSHCFGALARIMYYSNSNQSVYVACRDYLCLWVFMLLDWKHCSKAYYSLSLNCQMGSKIWWNSFFGRRFGSLSSAYSNQCCCAYFSMKCESYQKCRTSNASCFKTYFAHKSFLNDKMISLALTFGYCAWVVSAVACFGLELRTANCMKVI